MRFLIYILFLFISHLGFAQLSFVQPLENDLSGNKLFGNHEHFLVCQQGVKLDSVVPSIGSVYRLTDSSLKFKLPFDLTKGKMSFNVVYTKGGKKIRETLWFDFVPKNRYSFKVENLKGAKASLKELNSGNIRFRFFYDNDEISCKLECVLIVHVPKRGEMPGPTKCCTKVSDCIKILDVRTGDRIFLERPTLIYNGKKILTTASFALSY